MFPGLAQTEVWTVPIAMGGVIGFTHAESAYPAGAMSRFEQSGIGS